MKCAIFFLKFAETRAKLTMHIKSGHSEDCELCSKVVRNQFEFRKHVDNVHIFGGDQSSLEDLGIVQKLGIMKRIKQNINSL